MGDDYNSVHQNDQSGENIWVLKTIRDNPEEANQFSATFQQYATARFGMSRENSSWQLVGGSQEENVKYLTDGSYTTWIMAPNTVLAESIQEFLQES